jgi:hypothetical protein
MVLHPPVELAGITGKFPASSPPVGEFTENEFTGSTGLHPGERLCVAVTEAEKRQDQTESGLERRMCEPVPASPPGSALGKFARFMRLYFRVVLLDR